MKHQQPKIMRIKPQMRKYKNPGIQKTDKVAQFINPE